MSEVADRFRRTLDSLLEGQRSVTDRDEREAMLQEIARYTADRALEVPLYNVNAIYGVSDRVENFEAAPDSRLRLTRVSVGE